MTKIRLDQLLLKRGLVRSRSEAENIIRLGKVTLGDKKIIKPGYFINVEADINIKPEERYVSRAGMKLASVARGLSLNFKDKVILDVGSSTGGFTDYSLKRGAAKVIAVDVGTEQMHPSLRSDPRIELFEKTDIRNIKELSDVPDIVLIDVSFISLREILPDLVKLIGKETEVVAMFKPQFEIGEKSKNKGVIKNDSIRRKVIRDFEEWAKKYFVVLDKADSEVKGAKGNWERFYKLLPLK